MYFFCGMVEDVKVSISKIYGCRLIPWPEGVADILNSLHAEVWGVEVRRIQLQDGSHTPTLFWNEKYGTDIAEGRRKKWNFLYGPLRKEGIHLLVDAAIVLALRGGAGPAGQEAGGGGGGAVK
jgi:hypothetical protein